VQTFEWDDEKRLINAQKHKIDFVDAVAIFEGDIVTIEDDRFAYGEQRFISLGLLKGRVIVVTHTERGNITRIIPARRATKYEQTRYFDEIAY